MGEDMFKLVDAKVKSAMTRELNTGVHAVKVMIPTGKKRKGVDDSALDEEGAEEALGDGKQEAEQDEKSDDEVGGSLIKMKKAKAKAKGRAGGESVASGDSSQVPQAKGRAKGKAKA